MTTLNIAIALLPLIASSPAVAATVSDPVGDFIPSFTGAASPDLDVTSFSVSLDPSATLFALGAVLAGDIDPSLAGFYVIGMNTGSGTGAAVRRDWRAQRHLQPGDRRSEERHCDTRRQHADDTAFGQRVHR
jgi:hypothetical protein